MSFYRRHVLPLLVNCACGAKQIKAQREKIAPRAEGVVLELGFGGGLNLPFFDASKVTRLYALEPEEGMLVRARKAVRKASMPVEILPERAEALSLPDASVDTVLVTYALCTIADPAAALAGVRRVLKPGGKLLFCEHGLAPDANVRCVQRRIEPIWKPLAGGCHLTRDPAAMLTAAGFEIADIERGYLPGMPRFGGFNYRGAAVAAG